MNVVTIVTLIGERGFVVNQLNFSTIYSYFHHFLGARQPL